MKICILYVFSAVYDNVKWRGLKHDAARKKLSEGEGDIWDSVTNIHWDLVRTNAIVFFKS